MKAFTLLLVPVLSAVSASAHGILTGFGINGAPQSREVIRQVSSQDPNYGAGNPALTCGPNARNAGQSASVKPGDTLTFDWRTASGSPWPHNTGPMLTYMASCGDGPCSQFNAAGAQWFKIDQVGRKDGGAWFQQDLMSGAPASVRLPNVAPGNYLIRHEVIALHLAGNPQGAEFYPGCVQVQVTGSGTGRPANGETRTFPGGYSDNDPGILVNAFDARTPYAFPGPNVAAFVAAGGSAGPAPPAPSPPAGNGNTSAPAPSPSAGNGNTGAPAPSPAPGNNTPTTTQPAPAPVKTGKSGSCKLKKKRSAEASASPSAEAMVEAVVESFKPRHLSRVMRRLAFDVSH